MNSDKDAIFCIGIVLLSLLSIKVAIPFVLIKFQKGVSQYLNDELEGKNNGTETKDQE